MLMEEIDYKLELNVITCSYQDNSTDFIIWGSLVRGQSHSTKQNWSFRDICGPPKNGGNIYGFTECQPFCTILQKAEMCVCVYVLRRIYVVWQTWMKSYYDTLLNHFTCLIFVFFTRFLRPFKPIQSGKSPSLVYFGSPWSVLGQRFLHWTTKVELHIINI